LAGPARKSQAGSETRIVRVRRVVQLAALAVFFLLFAAAIGPGRFPIPPEAFLRIDPLVALVTLVSAQTLSRSVILGIVLFALPVAVLGLLTERAFCGWLCPLGTLIDTSDRIFASKKARRHVSLPWLKFAVLACVALGAVAGLSLLFLVDPIVLLTRSLTLGAVPGGQAALKRLAEAPAVGPLASWLPYVGLPQWVYRSSLVSAGILVGVLALSAMGRRFWCRNLCPLGALLGLTGRAAVLRLRVGEACAGCDACVRACKMDAIKSGEKPTYISSECVSCYSCIGVCPKGQISITGPVRHESRSVQLNVPRRRVLQAGALGIGWALLGKFDVAGARSESGVPVGSPHLLRAPGAVAEEEFLRRCVRCAQCIKVCPNGALQPALAEAGAAGFWTPVVVPRINYCAEVCNACARACPTSALEPFEIREKKWLFIGTAVIDRSRCITWNSDRVCLVCDEQCSYRAVYWQTVDGRRRPFVNDHVCVGCGICENRCPVGPDAAIRVFNFGDRRDWSRQDQKRFRAAARPLGEHYTLPPIE
jgi:polyferredoxin